MCVCVFLFFFFFFFPTCLLLQKTMAVTVCLLNCILVEGQPGAVVKNPQHVTSMEDIHFVASNMFDGDVFVARLVGEERARCAVLDFKFEDLKDNDEIVCIPRVFLRDDDIVALSESVNDIVKQHWKDHAFSNVFYCSEFVKHCVTTSKPFTCETLNNFDLSEIYKDLPGHSCVGHSLLLAGRLGNGLSKSDNRRFRELIVMVEVTRGNPHRRKTKEKTGSDLTRKEKAGVHAKAAENRRTKALGSPASELAQSAVTLSQTSQHAETHAAAATAAGPPVSEVVQSTAATLSIAQMSITAATTAASSDSEAAQPTQTNTTATPLDSHAASSASPAAAAVAVPPVGDDSFYGHACVMVPFSTSADSPTSIGVLFVDTGASKTSLVLRPGEPKSFPVEGGNQHTVTLSNGENGVYLEHQKYSYDVLYPQQTVFSGRQSGGFAAPTKYALDQIAKPNIWRNNSKVYFER